MMRPIRPIIALIAAVFLTASLAAPGSSRAIAPSFVGTSPGFVAFIQWTESRGGYLTGQYQEAYIAGSHRLRVESINASFTGVRNGQQISITFQRFFLTQTWTGTLRGSTLTLTISRPDDLLATLVMRAGTVQDYNRAVAAIKQRVASINEAADRREAVIRADNAFRRAHAALQDDVIALDRSVDFADLLNEYGDIWAEMQQGYAELRTGASQQPLTCVQLGGVEVDLGGLEVAMGRIEVVDGSLDVRRGILLDRTADVRQDISAMWASLRELERAVAADPAKTVSSQQVAQQREFAKSAEKDANDRVAAALAALRSAEAQARSYNERARRLLSDEQQYVASLKCTD